MRRELDGESVRPASPVSGGGDGFPAKCDLAGAETLRAAGGGADDERALGVDAHGGAGDGAVALGDLDRLAAAASYRTPAETVPVDSSVNPVLRAESRAEGATFDVLAEDLWSVSDLFYE